jgi:hypothetical protein
MTALALAKRNMSVGVNMTEWHMNNRVDSWHGQFAGHETHSSSGIPAALWSEMQRCWNAADD